MISEFLDKYITSGAAVANGGMVEHGYAQVEPNHLSAQRTGQIYAQLPADPSITVLENGQFACYDYAAGLVKLPGDVGKVEGEEDPAYTLEPMLVFNEIKLYREHQLDCEFAMVKDNYNARIYSPLDPETLDWTRQSRFYNGNNGVDATTGQPITTIPHPTSEQFPDGTTFKIEDVTAPADMYEIHYNEEPWHIESRTKGKKMPENTTMVPRLFKTNVGDHYTTNAVKALFGAVAVGDTLVVGDDGFLKAGSTGDMIWQIVKKYTLPDRQQAVKVLRIK